MPKYLKELLLEQKWLVGRFFVTSIGRSLANATLVLMLQTFLSIMTGKGTTRLTEFLGQGTSGRWLGAGLLICAYLLGTILAYHNRIAQMHGARALELGLMDRLIRQIMRLGVAFVSRQSPGDLIQALRLDVQNYRLMLYQGATIVLEGTTAVGFLAVMIWISPKLTMWTLCTLGIGSVPTILVTRKRINWRAKQLRVAGYGLLDLILQILNGIRLIKTFVMEEREAENLKKQGNHYAEAFNHMTYLVSLGRVLAESIGGLGLIVVIVIGSGEINSGRLAWSALLAFVMASRNLFTPFYSIFMATSEIQTQMPSAQRIGEILESPAPVADPAHPAKMVFPIKRIRFENVSFAYEGYPPTLHDISFEVRAGETIGILGPSGSGKSTLLNLLLRFHDPTSGRIVFDGVDVRNLRMKEYYDSIAVVAQEPFLFATTVQENIRCSRPNAADEEVEDAARATDIHDEIASMPQGYATRVGIGGRDVSRGQAQRINVARALLRHAPVLVLDEATSSLDSVSEAEVQQSIDRLVQGRTSFVVAHRLSTLRNADRLIVLEGGRIVGIGTHTQLMMDCPLYRKLWEIQSSGMNQVAV